MAEFNDILPGVPDGRFAVPMEVLTSLPEQWRTNNKHLFFEVKTRTVSGDTKRVLSRLTGNVGGYKKSRLPSAVHNELASVLEDTELSWEWMKEYSDTHGECGRCGSPLTREDSLARTWGPICDELLAYWKLTGTEFSA